MSIGPRLLAGSLGALFTGLGGYKLTKYLNTPHDIADFKGRKLYHGTTEERMPGQPVGSTLKVKGWLYFCDSNRKKVSEDFANNIGVSWLRMNDEAGSGEAKVIELATTDPNTKYYRGTTGHPYFPDGTILEVKAVYQPPPPPLSVITANEVVKRWQNN